MLNYSFSKEIQVILLGLFVVMSQTALAIDTDQRKMVDGLLVYLGVLPAEMIRGHPKEHPDSQMHGGFPEDYRSHIMVALFDDDSGKRITAANVSARIIGVDVAGPERKLDAMTIEGKRTFGGYFRMPGTGPYRIEIRIRLPKMSNPVKAEFEWGKS